MRVGLLHSTILTRWSTPTPPSPAGGRGRPTYVRPLQSNRSMPSRTEPSDFPVTITAGTWQKSPFWPQLGPNRDVYALLTKLASMVVARPRLGCDAAGRRVIF